LGRKEKYQAIQAEWGGIQAGNTPWHTSCAVQFALANQRKNLFVRTLESVRITGQTKETSPDVQLNSEKLAVSIGYAANEEKRNKSFFLNLFIHTVGMNYRQEKKKHIIRNE
jgi:hypothetical protein